jgi:hypothetical protein
MILSIRSITTTCLCLIGLSPSALASGDFFHFRLSRYPVSAGECAASASQLGERFAQLTGATVMETSCQLVTQHGAEIDVIYAADKPMQFITTLNTEASRPQGAYKTKEACKSDRSFQWMQFHRATGLEPIAAYCLQEKSENGSNFPYIINVVGAGNPATHYRSLSVSMAYGPNHADAFIAKLKAHMSQLPGFYLAHMELVTDQFDTTHLQIGYYADFMFRMQEIRQIQFTGQKACEAEIPELEAGLSAFGAQIIASTCQSDLYDTVILRSFYTPGPVLAFEDAHQKFSTYEECAANRQRVLDNLRDRLEWNVSAVICVESDGVKAHAVRKFGVFLSVR